LHFCFGPGQPIFYNFRPEMNALLNFDRAFFRLLNGKWHNALFDTVLPFVRNAGFWLPLYLFILIFLLANFRRCAWLILYTACVPALSDTFSSSMIKKLIFRPRPCGDPEMIGQVRFIVNYCPISSSFTSSHAANHFALATFLYFLLEPVVGRWAYIGFFWAALIAYAQIYVGVHYPFDVLGGAVVGMVTGWGVFRVLRLHLGPVDASTLLRNHASAKI
jgi:membrane-associated phospholipid phosphatase